MRDFASVAGALDFGPFLALPEQARRELAASATGLRLTTGERLIAEGETADAAFVLTAGLLRVESGGTFLTLMSPPALVGEMAVLERQPRSATVLADADSHLARIPAGVLLDAVARHEPFAAALRGRLGELAARTFLRKDSPFADLPGDVVDELARRVRPVAFGAGQDLFREGDPDDDIYLIRRGTVEVLRRTADRERRVATLSSGSFVGETAALTGAPRSATVRALGPVEAYRLAAADVRPLLDRHATLVERLGDALNVRHRPRKAPSVSTLPSPDDPGSVILRNDANGRYLQVSHDARLILEDLDGERTIRDLVLRHFERTGDMDPPGVFRTIATLQAAGFASAPRLLGEEWRPDLRTRLLDLILAPRLEVRSADRLATALYRVLWPFATTPAVFATIAIGIVGALAFVAQAREISLGTFGLAGVIVAWAGLAVAGLGHELAHLLACKSFGSRPGRGGVGLMWFSPIIYVDTTDTWTLSRRERILVNAAGPVFNFGLAGVAALIALPVPDPFDDVLLWFAGMNYLAVVFNLSPLLEFDGYYVLTDLANTPMLRRRALHFVFRDLADRPRLPTTRFEWGLVAFSLAVVAYGTILAVFVLVTVPATLVEPIAARIGREWVLPLWLAIAAFMLFLTLGPLVGNVRTAREEEVSEASVARSAAS